jgi:hypothetical protein
MSTSNKMDAMSTVNRTDAVRTVKKRRVCVEQKEMDL